MSVDSFKAQFSGPTGRALYRGSSGRAIYSGRALVGDSACHIYGSGSFTSPWTQSKYDTEQAAALTGVRGDTSYSSIGAGSLSGAEVFSGCGLKLGTERVTAFHHLARFQFTIPSGKVGNIAHCSVRASCASVSMWDVIYQNNNTAWEYYSYEDFGCVLKLYFSSSSTLFSSGSGMLDGTGTVELDLDDVNDAHVAASRAVIVGSSGLGVQQIPYALINCDAAVSTLNGFSGSTLYLYAAITRPNLFPFLYSKPSSGTDSDFECRAQFCDPSVAFGT